MKLKRKGSDKMKNVIFIAPPAAGKGTISNYLIKNYGYTHLSTGDMLRDEVASGSPLGKEIENLISQGKLVSDELIIKLIEPKLKNVLLGKSFILDGYPRKLNQAEKLDEMLISMGVTNNVVITLDISLEEATKRAVGRIICPNCGRSYNNYYKSQSPLTEGICDDCGVALEKRSDDTEETFKVRYQTYVNNTSPIIDYYKEKGLLQTIDTMKSQDEIAKDILTVIADKNVSKGR